MNVTEAIRARRSIRKYVPQVKIPDEHLHTILEAAMPAPSACNSRPWEFVVLQSDKAREDALSIHPYASHLRDASLGILVCADEKAQSGIAKGFFPQDCGAAIENILLQSLELGYGSCWCGIYPNAERVQMFREKFGIDSTPIALVVIGKAEEKPACRGHYDESRVKIL